MGIFNFFKDSGLTQNSQETPLEKQEAARKKRVGLLTNNWHLHLVTEKSDFDGEMIGSPETHEVYDAKNILAHLLEKYPEEVDNLMKVQEDESVNYKDKELIIGNKLRELVNDMKK